MTRTKEELNQLLIEYETLNNKLKELTDEELKYVIGGLMPNIASADYAEDKTKGRPAMAA